MDEKKILAGFKTARRRSQLEPHKKLIFGLQGKGATVREIVHVLSEKMGLKVDQSTVSRFIARQKQLDQERAKLKPQSKKPPIETATLTTPAVLARPREAKTNSPKNDWRQQVEALKQQPVKEEYAEEKPNLAPVGPLTLVKKD